MIPAFIIFFIALPLLEIYLLIQVGSWLGALPTIALLILAAALGILLLRWQGFNLARRLRASMARGEPPALEALKSVIILCSGILLLVPGFFTDAIALCLLIPGVRGHLAAQLLSRQGIAPDPQERDPQTHGHGPHTLEGEFRRETPVDSEAGQRRRD